MSPADLPLATTDMSATRQIKSYTSGWQRNRNLLGDVTMPFATLEEFRLDKLSGLQVTAMASAQRQLSAILHADLAGFVRLVEDEEDLTFQRLRSARAEVWRPVIENAGGALVNSAGNSMLVEFNSARAAVLAAIDIQERMTQFQCWASRGAASIIPHRGASR